MDPKLYKTIKSGDIDGLKQILSANDHDLYLHQTTPFKSTILHVAVQFKSSCFEEIYNRCPSLLIQANSNGDTPLHIAARLGFGDAVSFFTNPSKIIYNDIENNGEGVTAAVDNDSSSSSSSLTPVQKLVRMGNKKNDTALHEAVINDEFEVVKMLTEADPSFEYFANDAGETPLYLAIERNFLNCFNQILDTCPSSAHGGPFGRTVLHALAMNSDTSDVISYLLEKKPSIIKEVDDFGLSALHYAAYCGLVDQVVKLLEADPSVAYMADKAGKTALHYAANRSTTGSIEPLNKVIVQLIESCPDCWEQLDNNGWNFLHVAAHIGNDAVFKHFMSNSRQSNNGILMENLINQPDVNGDTPFHLAAKSEQLLALEFILKCNRVDKMATNKDNLTAMDLIYPDFESYEYKDHLRLGIRNGWRLNHIHGSGGDSTVVDGNYKDDEQTDKKIKIYNMFRSRASRRQKEAEGLRNLSETHILVATLIATVTFAAGFTLPGGYNSDIPHKGMAVLARKPAFIAFLISNSTAMLLSTFTIFIQLWAKFLEIALDFTPQIRRKYLVMDKLFLFGVAMYCTFGAIIAMVVAFVMGTYSVLLHLPGLAIPLCIFGCSFFIFCLVFIVKIGMWAFNI